MLDIKIEFNDIKVSNINKEDLIEVQKWMECQKNLLPEETDADDLKERFLESYISECEFFLKINKHSKLIGILKGRLEFRNPNEAWIWFFYINDSYKNTEISNITAKEIMKYFFSEYGIDIFFIRIIKEDKEILNFWKCLGFKSVRMVKNFYSIDGKYKDMIIMKKIGI
jgi:RimJ/RimL family protein N-acetyltransferase